MTGPWEDDDDAAPGDGDPSGAPPLPPDDRLWRHPSEVARGLNPPVPTGAPVRRADSTATPTSPRPWALTLTAGLTGAALAVGIVTLVGGFGATTERVVERVRAPERLAGMARQGTTDPALVGELVAPSLVRVQVDGPDGPRSGSGIVLLDDGHIMTSAVLVEDADEVRIVTATGDTVAAVVVGSDPATDVAVVAPAEDTGGPDWIPVVRGTAADLAVGDAAVAVLWTDPAADAPTTALTAVAALGRRATGPAGRALHGLIETAAPLEGAVPGGALCDRTGALVGVTAAAADPAGAAGGPFATPIEVAWAVAEDLIEGGVAHHVWLGIEGADLATATTSLLGLSSTGAGVLVHRVSEGGPAAAAGIVAGDALLALEDEPIASMVDLVLMLRRHEPGDHVRFTVHHDGTLLERTVVLGEH